MGMGSGSRPAWSAHIPPEDREWIEMRNGTEYCTLCSCWCTGDHLTGKTHKKKRENLKWSDAAYS